MTFIRSTGKACMGDFQADEKDVRLTGAYASIRLT